MLAMKKTTNKANKWLLMITTLTLISSVARIITTLTDSNFNTKETSFNKYETLKVKKGLSNLRNDIKH